jgi:hypothetical protein
MSENSFGGKYDWLKYLNTPSYVKDIDVLNNNRPIKKTKWRNIKEVVKMMKGSTKV